MTTLSPSADPCELLDWDTTFFGFPIARVRGDRLDEVRVEQIDWWCRHHRVACLYFLCGLDDPATTALAEDHGFHLADVRLTFETSLPARPPSSPSNSGIVTRPVCPADVSHLQAMARTIYHDSRFYFDRRFPKARSAALYETWIQRSCEGYAQQVIVAVHDRTPVGFVTCHLEAAAGRIGLIGVNNRQQRQGVGQAVLVAAMQWFGQQSLARVTVVTQARNYAAQRLFQRAGFLVHKVQVWYHKWYELPT